MAICQVLGEFRGGRRNELISKPGIAGTKQVRILRGVRRSASVDDCLRSETAGPARIGHSHPRIREVLRCFLPYTRKVFEYLTRALEGRLHVRADILVADMLDELTPS
jgi:hypothetical protein